MCTEGWKSCRNDYLGKVYGNHDGGAGVELACGNLLYNCVRHDLVSGDAAFSVSFVLPISLLS